MKNIVRNGLFSVFALTTLQSCISEEERQAQIKKQAQETAERITDATKVFNSYGLRVNKINSDDCSCSTTYVVQDTLSTPNGAIFHADYSEDEGLNTYKNKENAPLQTLLKERALHKKDTARAVKNVLR